MSNNIIKELATENLSSAKKELLKKLSRNNSTPPLIEPKYLDKGILSSTQQRLYYLQKLNPNSGFYNVPTAIEINAKIDPLKFEESIHMLVKKHEILRTSYHEDQDLKLIQKVNEFSEVEFRYIEFDEDSISKKEEKITNFILNETQKSLPLEKTPIRYFLLKNNEHKYVFLFIAHHIMMDGRTTEILINDLKGFYENNLNSNMVIDKKYNFIDFALWEKDYFTSNEYENSLNYWKKQLDGIIEPIDLPKDYVRKNESNRIGSRVLRNISSEQLNEINRVAREFKTTNFVFFYTCLNLLIHKLTNNSEITIGTQVANRKLNIFNDIAGYFANTVVLKTPIKENYLFTDFLKKCSETVLDAYTHQNVPFEKIVEMKGHKRNLSLNPIFQIMLVYQVSNFESLQFDEGVITPIEFHNGTSKFDLDISIVESADGIVISFEYDSELFKEETIESFLNCFMNIIETKDLTNKRISNIDILDKKEKMKITSCWNSTETEFSNSEWPIHKFIEEWEMKDPNADALLLSNEKISRGDLSQKANQIAWWLIDMKLANRPPIGICLDRSVSVVSSLLGIVKSGSPYLPIDPILPDERIEFMINDSQVPIIITSTKYVDKFKNTNAKILNLDEFSWDLSKENPNVDVTSDDLLYVIYTSGTSGKPKGVMLNHRGRVNNFFDFINRFNIGENDKLLSISALSFDMTAFDILGILASGATIVLPNQEEERNPEIWYELINKYNVSIWHSAPALLKLLIEKLESINSERHLNLRLVLLGGDWIPLDLQGRLNRFNGKMQYISLGGATEVSMDSTIYEVEKTESHWNSIPYGRPMANQRAYVVDEYGFAVPVGVSGELCLGGIGVGYGYLNQPALTAEKFIPDPYWVPGARMYRTGDLAKFHLDGTLELLGRIDFQIKIDGYRIEAGEIESLIKQYPGIDSSVVSVYKESKGKEKLVAYYTQENFNSVNTNELRGFLADKLPYYMVPMFFVELEKMPLSPNGKVNRKGLPKPVLGEANKKSYIPPQTKNEILLCEVWSDILNNEINSINNNFFELGGDSIKAIQVITEIRKLGFSIELKDIIKYPTIEELAKVMIENKDVNSVSMTGEQIYLLATGQYDSINTIEIPISSSISKNEIMRFFKDITYKLDAFKLLVTKENNYFTQSYHEKPAEIIICEQSCLPDETQFTGIKNKMKFNSPFPVHVIYVDLPNEEGIRLFVTISQLIANKKSMIAIKKLLEGYINNSIKLEESPKVFATWSDYTRPQNQKELYDFFKRAKKFEKETLLSEQNVRGILTENTISGKIGYLNRVGTDENTIFRVGCCGRIEWINKDDTLEMVLVVDTKDQTTNLNLYVLAESIDEKKVLELFNSLDTISELKNNIEYPTLPMQKHMIKQLHEQSISGLYNIQSGFFIPGVFDKEAFIKSYEYLIDQFQILRAYFITDNRNNPRIAFRSEMELPLVELDWSSYSESEIRAGIEKVSTDTRSIVLNLNKAPLWKIFLIKISDDLTLFLHFNCYALLDGWSMYLIRRELFKAYQNLTMGNAIPVKSQSLSFSDCCQIINELDIESIKNYWEDKIDSDDIEASFDEKLLPTVTEVNTFKQTSFLLDESINKKLSEVSRLKGLTKTVVISYVWGKTMKKITEREKVMFGVTMSGRSLALAGIESVPGLFINTLPVVLDFSLEESSEKIINRLRKDLAESDGREQIALDQLKQIMRREKCKDLFDSILVFDNYPADTDVLKDYDFLNSHPFANINLSIAQTEFPLRVDIWLEGNTQFVMSWYENKFSKKSIKYLYQEFSKQLDKYLSSLDN